MFTLYLPKEGPLLLGCYPIETEHLAKTPATGSLHGTLIVLPSTRKPVVDPHIEV